ncbi:MAG: hypothetical protein WCK02_02105 [Bacteroidota bacterium]
MDSEKSQVKTAVEWADFVITIWIEQMAKLRVSNAYLQAESFKHAVISNANGDVNRIIFTFDYFLRFTDMGVGNGVSLSESMKGTSNRKRKMWYSKTFLREVRILVDIIAQQYGKQSQMIIVTNLENAI